MDGFLTETEATVSIAVNGRRAGGSGNGAADRLAGRE
jgi:hypothetical protein